MALDTRNKRASAIGIGLAALAVLPAPDGTVAQPDRQQVAYSYAGTAATPLVSYDALEWSGVTVAAAYFNGVTIASAGFADVSLEPD